MPAENGIATTDSQSSIFLAFMRSQVLNIQFYLPIFVTTSGQCQYAVWLFFLFNGENQQSDVIRVALMTGWLPNPARFHALLMLICWIQHWNGEIQQQTENKRERKIERSGIWNYQTGVQEKMLAEIIGVKCIYILAHKHNIKTSSKWTSQRVINTWTVQVQLMAAVPH